MSNTISKKKYEIVIFLKLSVYFFTGWKYFGFFLYGKPCFVPLSLDITKCILAKDFDHFSERGLYYNEKDDPICKHFL